MPRSLNIYLTMLALFCVSICFGQDLDKHRWKKRILLIAAKEENRIENQLKVLLKDKDGLEERKLVIYKVLPTKFIEGIENQTWIKNKKFFTEIKKKEADLEIILVGLDGGVKLRQTDNISLDKLFTLIDGMPMRRGELKN